MKRKDKLSILREAKSIAGFEDWQTIQPDSHNDWISKRNAEFQELIPIGTKETKAGKSSESIFRLFSGGYKTGRDEYIYNFSREDCLENARRMVDDYMGAVRKLAGSDNQSIDVDAVSASHSKYVKWDRELKNNARRGKTTTYSPEHMRHSQYRPFVKQYSYIDYIFASMKYQQDSIFPSAKSKNYVICAPGIGSSKRFSALIVDCMSDLGLNSATQCFPRYRFELPSDSQRRMFDDSSSLNRIDNITDWALRKFRIHYNDNSITKNSIFEYVYGVLHSPEYSDRFSNDLKKELARIPLAPNFRGFTDAGSKLAKLHLNYESCSEFPLETLPTQPGRALHSSDFQLGRRKMRFADEQKSTLAINENVKLTGIPSDTHKYIVNGRSPLEWFIDRYFIKQHKHSGIIDDPNQWFEKPEDLITAIQRIVHVSIESVRIIENLPKLLDDE